MFLTEEIAKTGNTIDEPTSGTTTEPGFVFVANSQLDDDNTYAISTQSSYDLDFSFLMERIILISIMELKLRKKPSH